MRLVKVTRNAQVTLPLRVRKALGIEEGDYVEVAVEGNKVVMTPKTLITKLPPVALSEQGEQMLEEALDEVRRGEVREHESVESLLQELHDEADQD